MNMPTFSTLGAVFAAATAFSSAQAQYLMVPDADGVERIVLLSKADGSVVNANFITGVAPYDFITPKEALQVGNEIWVSDQVSDAIYRFTASLTPAYIGTISSQFDNMRGIAHAGSFVYVCNDGDAGLADQNRVYKLDLQGNYVSEIVIPDPYDVIAYPGGIMVVNWQDDLVRFDLDGNSLGTFFNSPGTAGNISDPQQIFAEADGSVWVTSSLAPTNGLFKIDSTGVQVYSKLLPALSVARGICKLDNGLMIFAQAPNGAGGIYTLDPVNDIITPVLQGSQGFQFINPLMLAPVASGCQPADIADDSGNPLPSPGVNTGVNEGDYNAFFAGFFDALAYCDQWDDAGVALSNPGHGPNNGVNEGDYNGFFATFFDGCP